MRALLENKIRHGDVLVALLIGTDPAFQTPRLQIEQYVQTADDEKGARLFKKSHPSAPSPKYACMYTVCVQGKTATEGTRSQQLPSCSEVNLIAAPTADLKPIGADPSQIPSCTALLLPRTIILQLQSLQKPGMRNA